MPEYHSIDYWNERYKDEAAPNNEASKTTADQANSMSNVYKDGKGISQVTTATASMSFYEWYLPFDKFAFFLRRDITRAFEDIDYEDLKAYIPGCGNSLLAEDLYGVGKSSL